MAAEIQSGSVESSTPAVPLGPDDDEPPQGWTLDVVMQDTRWSVIETAQTLVETAARALAGNARIRLALPAAACVALADDATLRQLNRDWRSKDQPTNVLSFPSTGGACAPGEARFLGDVILAAETVFAEAAELGIPAAHHLQHLVVHGLLHLLGFDHEKLTFRLAGRDFRLTDVHGKVVKQILS